MSDNSAKTALVIGASRGIGRACAIKLAEAGVNVVIASRTEKDINSLVEEIERTGGNALAVKTDVTKKEDIQNLVWKSMKKFGKIDIMVYSSGIARVENSLAESTDENYRDTMDVNVRGAYWSMKEVLNSGKMLENSSGRIIVIASDSAKQGEPGLVVYNTSKHAVLGLVRGAAMEFGSKGITVNAVCPGFVQTDMADDLAPKLAKLHNISEEDTDEFLRSCDPLNRISTPEEVAQVVVFLATTEGGGAMTGQGVTMATTVLS